MKPKKKTFQDRLKIIEKVTSQLYITNLMLQKEIQAIKDKLNGKKEKE